MVERPSGRAVSTPHSDRTSGWIVARIVEVRGALSQGRTREEARENVIDALRLMLSPDGDDAAAAAGRSEQLDLILTG